MDFTGIWLELTALYWDLLGSTWFHETSPAFARFDIGSTEFDRVCPRRPQPPTSRPKPSSPSPVWLERLEYDTKIHHGRRPMTTPSPPFYAPFDCPGRRRPLPLIYDRISAAVASLHAQLETPSSRAPPPPPPHPSVIFFLFGLSIHSLSNQIETFMIDRVTLISVAPFINRRHLRPSRRYAFYGRQLRSENDAGREKRRQVKKKRKHGRDCGYCEGPPSHFMIILFIRR